MADRAMADRAGVGGERSPRTMNVRPVRLRDLTAGPGAAWPERLAEIFPAQSPDFPARARAAIGDRVTPAEAVRLSELFVSDRLRALGRIRPSIPDAAAARLLFLPVPEPTAVATASRDGYLALVTLGLVELLRTHGTASVWAGRLADLEQRLGEPLVHARRVRDYVNLRTLLYFCGHPPLLELEEVVAPDVRRMGQVVSEVACLFVILHEYGHAYYGTLTRAERGTFARRIQLARPEPMNPWKEEFFADQFALRCVEPAVMGPLVHASLLFFSIQAFAEAHGLAESDRHPRATNRLAALIAYARERGCPDDGHLEPPARQLASLERMGDPAPLGGAPRTRSKRLSQLLEVADALGREIDWREGVASVCALEREVRG